MIDWAWIRERGDDVISSLSPSVFSFSNWLTAFLVPSEACQLAYCLKKALFLSVWLIESLAVCLKQLILSCQFKRLSHFFNQHSVCSSSFLFYLCWYTISWKDLCFVFFQLFANFSRLCWKFSNTVLYAVFDRCAVTVVLWGKQPMSLAYPVTTTYLLAISAIWCPGPAVWKEPQRIKENVGKKCNPAGGYFFLFFNKTTK